MVSMKEICEVCWHRFLGFLVPVWIEVIACSIYFFFLFYNKTQCDIGLDSFLLLMVTATSSKCNILTFSGFYCGIVVVKWITSYSPKLSRETIFQIIYRFLANFFMGRCWFDPTWTIHIRVRDCSSWGIQTSYFGATGPDGVLTWYT